MDIDNFVIMCPAPYHQRVQADLEQSSFYHTLTPTEYEDLLGRARRARHPHGLRVQRARRPPTFYATYNAHKSKPAFRFITASPDVPTTGAATALTAALRALDHELLRLFK